MLPNCITTEKPSGQVLRHDVEFMSDEFLLKGNLYYPQSAPFHSLPALIIGGSWTTVKEQMAGYYAEQLARHGYICLAFDARNFGESEGDPRFYESPEKKIRDFRNAISFLTTLPDVDVERIGVVGICAAAGYMARVAIDDERVKGIAMVASWLHNTNSIINQYGGISNVVKVIERAQNAKKQLALTGNTEYTTLTSLSELAATPDIASYFSDTNRGAKPEWIDQLAVMSYEDWLTFSPIPEAKQLTKPIVILHSLQAALPENIKLFFSQLSSKNKALRWIDGKHSDFYDNPKQVHEAVVEIARFFKARF